MTRRKHVSKTKAKIKAWKLRSQHSTRKRPQFGEAEGFQPVPERLYPQFREIMSELTNSDMSDAMWWHEMECAAEDFLEKHNLEGNPFDAIYQYLNEDNEKEGE